MKEVGRYDTEMQQFVDAPRDPNVQTLDSIKWSVDNNKYTKDALGPTASETRLYTLAEIHDQIDISGNAETVIQTTPAQTKGKKFGPYDGKLQMFQEPPHEVDEAKAGFVRWLKENDRLTPRLADSGDIFDPKAKAGPTEGTQQAA